MINITKYIKALLHPAGGQQGSHKAHQADNQRQPSELNTKKQCDIKWTNTVWPQKRYNKSMCIFCETYSIHNLDFIMLCDMITGIQSFPILRVKFISGLNPEVLLEST